MIYIIDNGGRYSDHRIAFVQAAHRIPLSVMHELAKRSGIYGERGEIIGRSINFEWFKGEPMSLLELISDAEDGAESVRADQLDPGPPFTTETMEWVIRLKLERMKARMDLCLRHPARYLYGPGAPTDLENERDKREGFFREVDRGIGA